MRFGLSNDDTEAQKNKHFENEINLNCKSHLSLCLFV